MTFPRSRTPEAPLLLDIPAWVEVYEINGPFFFGAAEKFKETITELQRTPKVLIIRMRNVPAMDSTGLDALRDVVGRSVGPARASSCWTSWPRTISSATSTTRSTPRASTSGSSPWRARISPRRPWRARTGASTRVPRADRG